MPVILAILYHAFMETPYLVRNPNLPLGRWHNVMIEDKFEISDSTKNITWALMTVANVRPIKNGAILKQSGKELRLQILSPSDSEVSVIPLDPPPLKIDKTIDNLKRIEIRIPADAVKGRRGLIQVRLSGEK